MLENYFKIAWRNLVKNKVSSFINIGGLAVGMAVALLNGLWINDELSFNAYHKNYDHIAQINYSATKDGDRYVQKQQSYLLADVIKANYGRHFSQIVMSTHSNEYILSSGQTNLSKNGQFIEAAGPELFTLNMLKGSKSGLQDPHSILISASTAKALFGDADPMNKVARINTNMDVTITGVYADLPKNSEFYDVNFFAPLDLYMSTNSQLQKQSWSNHTVSIYAQIQPDVTFDQVSADIKGVLLDQIRNMEGMAEKKAESPQLFMNPMKDWHLYNNFKSGASERGPIYFVWMIGLTGVFVLLLACINFMNLSTARSEKRAKEVGIRKTLGSQKGQLVRQFLSESFLIVLLAFVLALVITFLLLPWFNGLADKDIMMPWTDFYFWLISLSFILLTSLIAGSYPAIYLSSFQPVKVLKGTFKLGNLAALPRKVLVVTQFTVSVTLVICTIVVFRQINYVKDRPVGYSRDGLLMIQKKTDAFKGKFDLLRSELLRTGVVNEVAESNNPATGYGMANGGFDWKGRKEGMDEDFGTLSVSPEYGKTIGWQFVAGRDFSPDLPSDSSGFVVNEAAVKYMKLKDPVGEIVQWNPKWRKAQTFKIIGVIKDMVSESPFEEAKPTVFFLFNYHKWINIRLNPQVSTHEALSKIEAVFKNVIPDTPFDYQFADEEYARKFAAEERIGKLATFFASLAIFISCLGLFGLASFTAEQRTKEIGIRKVLGASMANVWEMLSKDFIKLVIISCVIAIPVSYYFMNNWLQNYQYRTGISWWVFGLATVGALLITLLTISFQAVKAATANPVKSLRTE